MLKKSLILICILLIIDQVIKIYIKTHFLLGEEVLIFGHWGRLNFIENEGMAFGIKWGGVLGKYALSLFRIVASVLIFMYMRRLIREKKHPVFIYSIAFIFTGAVGNIIDSMFYGLIFNDSGYYGFGGDLAVLFPGGGGYAGFLQGRVVDMFYFPIIHSNYPSWFPLVGGDEFMFFRPIFNFADACISIGVIAILLFYRKIFRSVPQGEPNTTVTENTQE